MALEEPILSEARDVRVRMLELQRQTEQARVDFNHAVRRLHAAGGSLREIADALGLSHQRVHQIVDGEGGSVLERILPSKRRGGRARSGELLSRFAGDARQAVVEAQSEARELRHNYVGTEHLLLGVLRLPETRAAKALATLDISLDTVREHVVAIIGRGSDDPPIEMPFTPRSKKVLEAALRQALMSGEPESGSEHLLTALVGEREGIAAQILEELGAEEADVRRALAA
jgi:hypothetical protein